MEFRKRLLAFIIDTTIFTIIFMLCNIIPIYDDFFREGYLNSVFYTVYLISLFVVMVAFVGKDVIKGKSIGKRIAKIKVVNSDNGNKPSFFRLFIRNITNFIWPIEALLLVIGKKRLGDVWAKTDVVSEE